MTTLIEKPRFWSSLLTVQASGKYSKNNLALFNVSYHDIGPSTRFSHCSKCQLS